MIIDDLRRGAGRNRPPLEMERLVGAGYRSVLGVSTGAPSLWSAWRSGRSGRWPSIARTCRSRDGSPTTSASERPAARSAPSPLRSTTPVRSGSTPACSEGSIDWRRAPHLRVVGESVEWRGVLRKATQVASTDTTVLMTGESGTGKEVVARFIHAASARKSRPFVALNCAALPEQLLESELFGYERGAFTSAQQAKPGQVELASGGVLFLDEVSEMSLSAQAKFLRVLQEREFQRLGGTRLLKANIRVIAATNRDLRKAVERGDFREDLFYRLGVFDIQIPPLRERPADIVPLSETLSAGDRQVLRPAGRWSDARGTTGASPVRMAWERARASQRPGAGGDSLRRRAHRRRSSDAAIRRQGHSRNDTTDLSALERTTIAKVLQECRGNKTKAARRLGLSRTQLHLRIRKYGLEEAATA